ncbi:hypothetical protein FKM82_013868, partial [Ascaphus truei]
MVAGFNCFGQKIELNDPYFWEEKTYSNEVHNVYFGDNRRPAVHRAEVFFNISCFLSFPGCHSLASPSPVHSANSESSTTPCEGKAAFTVIQSEDNIAKKEESICLSLPDCRAASPTIYPETSWEEHLLEQQDHLEKEMDEAKKMISGLQALLLNGSLPEDEQESLFSLREDGACPEEQLVIIKSRLDQSMHENQSLKNELLSCKQENRNIQGIKDALQQRMTHHESAVLQLKQELLRSNMDKDELHNQNVDLQRKMEERSQLLSEYKKELSQKDWLMQQMQGKLDEAHRKLSEANYQK